MNYLEWADKFLCKIYRPESFVVDKIIDAIKNDKPLSYVRLGDGELVLLREFFVDPYYANLCDPDRYIDRVSFFELPELNTLGYYVKKYYNETLDTIFSRTGINTYLLKKEALNIIGNNLLYALQNSSYIGIHELIDLEKNIDNFYTFTHSYTPHIELFQRCKVDFQKLTSINCIVNNSVLFNPYEFKKILNGKPLHIFTSNEYELRTVTKLDELLEAEITYTNLTPISKDWTTYSFAHQEFLKNKCKDIKEQIILYGLGGFTKNIPAFLSNNFGKTCIDMGSVLDGWAGKISRPYMNDLENYIIPVPKEQRIYIDII